MYFLFNQNFLITFYELTLICITLPQTKPQNDIKSFQDKKVEEPDRIYEYKTSEIIDLQ